MNELPEQDLRRIEQYYNKTLNIIRDNQIRILRSGPGDPRVREVFFDDQLRHLIKQFCDDQSLWAMRKVHIRFKQLVEEFLQESLIEY